MIAEQIHSTLALVSEVKANGQISDAAVHCMISASERSAFCAHHLDTRTVRRVRGQMYARWKGIWFRISHGFVTTHYVCDYCDKVYDDIERVYKCTAQHAAFIDSMKPKRYTNNQNNGKAQFTADFPRQFHITLDLTVQS